MFGVLSCCCVQRDGTYGVLWRASSSAYLLHELFHPVQSILTANGFKINGVESTEISVRHHQATSNSRDISLNQTPKSEMFPTYVSESSLLLVKRSSVFGGIPPFSLADKTLTSTHPRSSASAEIQRSLTRVFDSLPPDVAARSIANLTSSLAMCKPETFVVRRTSWYLHFVHGHGR